MMLYSNYYNLNVLFFSFHLFTTRTRNRFSLLHVHLQVEGTLSVQPKANPISEFEDYFLNLTVENNARNPWFVGK